MAKSTSFSRFPSPAFQGTILYRRDLSLSACCQAGTCQTCSAYLIYKRFFQWEPFLYGQKKTGPFHCSHRQSQHGKNHDLQRSHRHALPYRKLERKNSSPNTGQLFHEPSNVSGDRPAGHLFPRQLFLDRKKTVSYVFNDPKPSLSGAKPVPVKKAPLSGLYKGQPTSGHSLHQFPR